MLHDQLHDLVGALGDGVHQGITCQRRGQVRSGQDGITALGEVRLTAETITFRVTEYSVKSGVG